MPASRLLSLALLSTATLSALALGPTGNEHYARNKVLRSLKDSSAIAQRDGGSTGLSYDEAGLTFTVGEGEKAKYFYSPTGDSYKNYKFDAEWGLKGTKKVAVTVINVDGDVTCDSLGKAVEKYLKDDDVFDEAFMQSVLLQTKSSLNVVAEAGDCLKSHWGSSLIMKKGKATSDVKGIDVALVDGDHIPAGPYMASIVNEKITLSEIYRVYKDEAQAFTTGTIPTVDGSFAVATTNLPGMNTLGIPVPSRLYTKYVENPRVLEGVRVGVKDIYDVAGLRTGGGSRAYWNTYEAAADNSFPVQRLVDQGAVIIGKIKTSQFANGETPTGDWVDQMASYQPRGDGYQQTSSSSTGSGAAQGAYDWLDHALGSDTGGSVRGPAGVVGLYGIRPSTGAISLEGVLPLASVLDTAGYFARDAVSFNEFGKAWYGDQFQNYTGYPSRLYAPSSGFPNASSPAYPVFTGFINKLSNFLGGATIVNQTYSELFAAQNYSEAAGQPLATYANTTYGTIITYFQWNNFGSQWFEDYASLYDGRQPFVSPSPNVRWAYGRNLTVADYQAALAQKERIRTFVNEVVHLPDNETCSDSIYLYPQFSGTPNYRNVYRPAPGVPNGFGNSGPSQMGELPEIVVPIGQLPYNSTITGHVEYLPVSLSMVSRHGCDYMLLDLVADLQKAGILAEVQTGSLPFAL